MLEKLINALFGRPVEEKKPAAKKPAAKKPAAKKPAAKKSIKEEKNTDNTSNGTIAVEDEISKSFLDYAMSVIVSRALPDVKDGLKPVQRRILYSMYETGIRPTGPFRKCSKVVGDVMGNYHPHGNDAIYGTLVRLGQNFSTRYPLIEPQGNFGTPDDPPAAMRYTESRMSSLSSQLLDGIDEDTVTLNQTIQAKHQSLKFYLQDFQTSLLTAQKELL